MGWRSGGELVLADGHTAAGMNDSSLVSLQDFESRSRHAAYLINHQGKLSLAIPPVMQNKYQPKLGSKQAHCIRCTSPVFVVW